MTRQPACAEGPRARGVCVVATKVLLCPFLQSPPETASLMCCKGEKGPLPRPCNVHAVWFIRNTSKFPIQVSAVFDSASSPACHTADRDPRGERQVTNYHSKGPSRHPILRWFKVRFVRTGTKMACRYIIEVPSLL